MKKYISLMNPYTFYYIWNSKYKHHLENMIKEILDNDDDDDFVLSETFNNDSNNLKSYIFLENDKNIIYIEFTLNENVLSIYNYLEVTSNKKVILVIFNSFKGKSISKSNIYYIYQNEKNNQFLKLFLASNFKEQNKSELKDLLNYLYNLDEQFYFNYLREEKLKLS